MGLTAPARILRVLFIPVRRKMGPCYQREAPEIVDRLISIQSESSVNKRQLMLGQILRKTAHE